jgi:hypothetical protein
MIYEKTTPEQLRKRLLYGKEFTTNHTNHTQGVENWAKKAENDVFLTVFEVTGSVDGFIGLDDRVLRKIRNIIDRTLLIW